MMREESEDASLTFKKPKRSTCVLVRFHVILLREPDRRVWLAWVINHKQLKKCTL
jgi:hypothetical protein